MPHANRTRIFLAASIVGLAAIAMIFSAPSAGPSAASFSPLRETEKGRGWGNENSEILAKLYPVNAATRYARIAPVADGFAPPDMQSGLNSPGSRWKNPAKTVQPVFPKSFNNPVRVRSGVADVSAVPLNANPDSPAELDAAGNLIYPNAFGPGIDVIYRCEALKTEEFIVIRSEAASPLFALPLREGVGGGVSSLSASIQAKDAAVSSRRDELKIAQHFSAGSDAIGDSKVPKGRLNPLAGEINDSVVPTGLSSEARSGPSTEVLGYSQSVPSGRTASAALPISFSWDLHPGALKPRLTPAHTIELCDENAVPRLRINAPEGKDASGKPLRVGTELRITLEGNRVTLAADTRGLDFPIVIDPTWSSTGAMATARFDHAATLLNDGTVLLCGGYETSTSLETSTVEIFDPVSITFHSAENLAGAQHDLSAITLLDGKVIVFGWELNQTELYDSSTGHWMTSAGPTLESSFNSIRMKDGRVMAGGGINVLNGNKVCKIYDPGTGNWSSTTDMNVNRFSLAYSVLTDGTIMASGGAISATCELYDVQQQTWTMTGSMSSNTGFHLAPVLNDGTVLSFGTASTSEIYDPVAGTWSSTGSKSANQGGSGCLLDFGSAFWAGCTPSTRELYNPATRKWTSVYSSVNVSRVALTTTLLKDGRVLVAGDIAACEIFDPYFPEVSATVDRNFQIPGAAFSFSSNASDLPGSPMTYHWDFGDGTASDDQNPQHAYSSVGTFTVIVTATGGHGDSSTATLTVLTSLPPIVRVQTSDVVAFATQPFTFDASTSSDPENAIASYDWDFGDGTPHGSQQIITKVYDQPGTYTIKLTITDSAGVSSSTTRIIEVLGASEAGLFNGFINYKVGWDRNKENKDTLSLDASVNVGDDVIAAGTTVALEIVGQRFEGTLDTKLRDFTNVNEKWTVKAGVRHQPPGTVSVKLSLKKASLGSAFNLTGVVVGGDPHDIVSKTIPVHLEIGARSFELQVDSDFKFSGNGTRAKGDGASD
jgi:hypothetical protein